MFICIKLANVFNQTLSFILNLFYICFVHRMVPGRFAPLNRYFIIIDEVFFDNFLVIIYLLVVYKKKIT